MNATFDDAGKIIQNSSFVDMVWQNESNPQNTTNSSWQGLVTIQAGYIIVLVLFAVVMLAGIPGNVLIYLLYGGKGLKGKVMASLLRLLAVVDQSSILLFHAPIWVWYFFGKVANDLSLDYCRYIVMTSATLSISSWTLFAVSVDRVFCVFRPYLVKRPVYRTAILGSLVPVYILVSAFACTRIIVAVDVINGHCTVLDSKIWGLISTAIITYLPGCGMIVCNVILLVKLGCMRSNIVLSPEVKQRRKQNMIIILSLSILFVMTTCIPVSQLFTLFGNSYEIRYTGTMVFMCIRAINNSANFYILCITGSKFRSEFKKLITCSSNRVAPVANQA